MIHGHIFGVMVHILRQRLISICWAHNNYTLPSNGSGVHHANSNTKSSVGLYYKIGSIHEACSRENMQLDSYTCELCILQREEKLLHLFFKCSFAKNCWLQIGVVVLTWLRLDRATRHIKRLLGFLLQ
jgi:hypothetical protein